VEQPLFIGTYRKSEAVDGAERIPVAETVTHPDYDEDTMANDFMVVRLSDPIRNPEVLTPITLNKNESIPVKRELLTAMGYGATSHDGFGSFSLKKVDVKSVSSEKCNKFYGGAIVDAVMLCAGITRGGRDSCQVRVLSVT